MIDRCTARYKWEKRLKDRSVHSVDRRFCRSLLHLLFFVALLVLCSPIFVLGKEEGLQVLPSPVLSSKFFPCATCHDQIKKGQEQSKQDVHETIPIAGHIEKNYGCFGCHDSENLDKLRLFNGNKIDLALSSSLCGQCHSTNYKLWHSGLHGKSIGKWNGPKKITPCTRCHDPHRPGYTAHRPEQPPTPPQQTLRWKK